MINKRKKEKSQTYKVQWEAKQLVFQSYICWLSLFTTTHKWLNSLL